MRASAYRGTIFNSVIQQNTRGFFINDLNKFKKKYTTVNIQKNMEYRPDLIAAYYLGDPSLDWLITFVNEFTNGLEDYQYGREIKIPSLN